MTGNEQPRSQGLSLLCERKALGTRFENGGEQSPFICLTITNLTNPPRLFHKKHPRNERVTSAEELDTMSKNNLTGITLGIRPIL